MGVDGVETTGSGAVRLRSAALVRQRYACAYEQGPRPVPANPAPLRLGRPLLVHGSTLACAVTDEKVVALTYDDGPHPEHTPRVLDALAQAGVHATFFVLAEQARAHPEQLRRVAAAGHELGLHGLDHTRLSTLPLGQAVARVRDARREVEDLAGVPVHLFRPAYGAQTLPMRLATRALGLTTVLWSAWARDWEDAPAEDLARRAVDAAHPGGILLLHDASDGTDGTQPTFDRGRFAELMLAGLAGAGYEAMTVSALLRRARPAVTPMFETRAQARERAAALAPGAPA